MNFSLWTLLFTLKMRGRWTSWDFGGRIPDHCLKGMEFWETLCVLNWAMSVCCVRHLCPSFVSVYCVRRFHLVWFFMWIWVTKEVRTLTFACHPSWQWYEHPTIQQQLCSLVERDGTISVMCFWFFNIDSSLRTSLLSFVSHISVDHVFLRLTLIFYLISTGLSETTAMFLTYR